MARREDRKPLKMTVKIRVITGGYSGELTDLSQQGCRICTYGLKLAAGQKIILRPDGLEALSATVKWTERSQAGLEFEHPLHVAIVDHLCRMHPDAKRAMAVELA